MSIKNLIVARTPVPSLPELSCSVDRWTKHIVATIQEDGTPGHPELIGKEFAVKYLLESPSLVFYGDPRSNYVFTNASITNAKQYPLCVVASPRKQEVITAYYDRDLHASRFNVPLADIIWSREVKK